MIDMGVPHNTTVYRCMIQGYLNHGDFLKAKELITEMKTKGIHPRPRKSQRIDAGYLMTQLFTGA
jgi:pentatricopeptide repeat protein